MAVPGLFWKRPDDQDFKPLAESFPLPWSVDVSCHNELSRHGSATVYAADSTTVCHTRGVYAGPLAVMIMEAVNQHSQGKPTEVPALAGVCLMENDPNYDIMPAVRSELQQRRERIFHLLHKLDAVLGLNDKEYRWIEEYGGVVEK